MAGLQFHFEHVRSQLMREIGSVVTNDIRDPRVPPCVTILDIRLSADTRNATVFVSVFGDEKVRKGALIALNRAAPFVQRQVSRHVKLKHFPRLLFKCDEAVDRSLRVTELLKEIRDDLD